MLLKQQNPHGGDIYSRKVILDLSANMNPYGMPEKVREAVLAAADSCSVYPDPYCRELRRGISFYEGVPQDCILCGNGASELIYSFAMSLPADSRVLIVSPTFSEYETALDAAGITADHYVLSEGEGFALDERILDADLCAYSALVLCTPNNPTGICIDPGLLRKIAGTGIRILCDMCFMELTGDPDRYDVPSLLDKFPNIAVLKALTKNYSLAGVRLGYAMSSDVSFLEKMSSKVQCWNVSCIAQKAGTAALECREWLRDTVRKTAAERERLAGELASLGVKVFPGEANYLLLHSEEDLFEKLLEKGILIRDCSNYVGLEKGYYRTAVRTGPENDILIQSLREVL